MNENPIKDRFSADFDKVFGFTNAYFKLDGDREPPEHIPQWRINRTNARSIGKPMYLHTKASKCCGSLVRRVYDNTCYDCFLKEKRNANS